MKEKKSTVNVVNVIIAVIIMNVDCCNERKKKQIWKRIDCACTSHTGLSFDSFDMHSAEH